MSTSANPYAAPTAPVADAGAASAAEAIRREHLNHEASIKAVGFLYYLGGVIVTIAALTSLAGAANAIESAAVAVILLVVGAGQFAAGWGVRALRPWARKLGCAISALGLLGFPIGTLINGYILYLFMSKKGRFIFSPEYLEVIAATPDVKYRVSIVVWIFLALLVGLLLLGLGAALFAK